MKGLNTLELNESTMMQAVQLWLDSQFKDGLAPTVMAVSKGNGNTTTFKIDLKEKDAA